MPNITTNHAITYTNTLELHVQAHSSEVSLIHSPSPCYHLFVINILLSFSDLRLSCHPKKSLIPKFVRLVLFLLVLGQKLLEVTFFLLVPMLILLHLVLFLKVLSVNLLEVAVFKLVPALLLLQLFLILEVL